MNDLPAAPPPNALAFPLRQDLVTAFLSGREATTLRAYSGDLRALQLYLGAGSPAETAARLLASGPGAANALVLGWRADMVERGLSSAAVNRRLAAVRSLVRLARTLGHVPWALDVQDLRVVRYRDTRGPGTDAMRALLRQVEREAGGKTRTRARALRDKAVLRLLHDLALRRSEVTRLDLADVALDRDPATVQVRRKGRRQAPETRTLPAPTALALAAWAQARGQQPGPLFLGLGPNGGQRLHPRSVAKLLRALANRAGVTVPVRPHGLRHAGITAALEATSGDVRAVASYSGHRDVRTVLVYDDSRRDLAGEVARRVAEALS